MMNPIVRGIYNLMKTQGGDAMMSFPVGAPVYDPATSKAVQTVESYPVRVMVFDYIKKTDGIGTQGNSLIETGDKQMFVQPADDLPRIKARTTKVTFCGVQYDIITVKETNPSGTNSLLYELFIRE